MSMTDRLDILTDSQRGLLEDADLQKEPAATVVPVLLWIIIEELKMVNDNLCRIYEEKRR